MSETSLYYFNMTSMLGEKIQHSGVDPVPGFDKMYEVLIKLPLLMRVTVALSVLHQVRWSAAGLLLLITANPAVAGKLYKYQDQQGHWHFSDTLPENYAPPPNRTDAIAQPGQHVTIQNTGSDEQPRFEVSNAMPGPIELEFVGEEIVNMRATPPLPIRKVIPATSRQPLVRLEKIQPNRPWSYSYSTRFVIGNPKARHETGKPYLPPFAPFKDFTISQAFDDEQSHKQHPLTRYAVDIPMPVGTAIFASRSGTVMEIKSGKLSPLRKQATHYIRILHNDGTFGLYAHLDPASIKLVIGSQVNRGQAFAALGKPKSKSITPHLHFAVQKNVGMKLESIPFQFVSLDGTAVDPKAGLQLRHPL